jgi:hypothetical protein
MKRISLTITLVAAAFLSGFAFRTIISNKKNIKMKKVTGIGGVFFKCKDPKAINEWYKTHLGFDRVPMEQVLNGARRMTAPKKGLPSGIPSRKTRNTLSLPRETL